MRTWIDTCYAELSLSYLQGTQMEGSCTLRAAHRPGSSSCIQEAALGWWRPAAGGLTGLSAETSARWQGIAPQLDSVYSLLQNPLLNIKMSLNTIELQLSQTVVCLKPNHVYWKRIQPLKLIYYMFIISLYMLNIGKMCTKIKSKTQWAKRKTYEVFLWLCRPILTHEPRPLHILQ